MKRDFRLYRDKRLFYLNDTHWNSLGSFLGYRTLMDFIVRDFPGLKIFSIHDFNLDTKNSDTDDLTAMLSLNIPEKVVAMVPKKPGNARAEKDKLPVPDSYTGKPDEYEMRFANTGYPLKALIFRDSFFTAMIPFLKESFGESVFIWSPYDRSLIDIEKPDLVIFEVIEREIEVFENIDL
jgi:alginate O-acetyltransferase complex protein AlgJ